MAQLLFFAKENHLKPIICIFIKNLNNAGIYKRSFGTLV